VRCLFPGFGLCAVYDVGPSREKARSTKSRLAITTSWAGQYLSHLRSSGRRVCFATAALGELSSETLRLSTMPLAAFRGVLFRLSNRIQFHALPPKASTHSTMLPALADRGSFSKPMMHLVDVPGSVGQLASSSAFRSLWVVVCNPKSPRSQRSHIEEAGRRQMGPPTSS